MKASPLAAWYFTAGSACWSACRSASVDPGRETQTRARAAWRRIAGRLLSSSGIRWVNAAGSPRSPSPSSADSATLTQSSRRSGSTGSGAVAIASSGSSARASPCRANALAAFRRMSGCVFFDRLRQRRQGIRVDQRLHRREPDLAILVVDRPDEQHLRPGRVLLDQLVHGPLAKVGVARGQRRLEELEPLGLLEGEFERLAAECRIGVVEELQQEVPAPGLGDLGHRLGEHLAADVGVDAPQGEPERARAGPAHQRAPAPT